MELRRLWLTDFRCYERAEVTFAPGLTAILGPNGHGKTNLLEAIAYLATLSSFRGAPADALPRRGSDRAIVRAEADRGGRELLIEAELVPGGRSRIQLNRQKLQRSRDLLGALRVTVFAPDDLVVVKGGPGERRRYLDDTLVAVHPRNDALRTEVEKILRQRNALLKQLGGRLPAEAELTLEVWDQRLADAGQRLTDKRLELIRRLEPVLTEAYDQVAREPAEVSIVYRSEWYDQGLADALRSARDRELRRGSTLVGPQRDDVELVVGSMPARTHCSQGEQRSLALALKLAAHAVVTSVTESPPVLLLDDVFSELDPQRSDALLDHLPPGQTLLTSAAGLPPRASPEKVLYVRDGKVGASRQSGEEPAVENP